MKKLLLLSCLLLAQYIAITACEHDEKVKTELAIGQAQDTYDWAQHFGNLKSTYDGKNKVNFRKLYVQAYANYKKNYTERYNVLKAAGKAGSLPDPATLDRK